LGEKSGKNFAELNLAAELVKICAYSMKFFEADPCKDFFGVETTNFGPAPQAETIVLGLKIDKFSTCWTY